MLFLVVVVSVSYEEIIYSQDVCLQKYRYKNNYVYTSKKHT